MTDIAAGQYHVFSMSGVIWLAVANVNQRLTSEQADDLAAKLTAAVTIGRAVGTHD